MSAIFSQQLLQFYKELSPPGKLPPGVNILYPQQDAAVMCLLEQFLASFYDDNNQRRLINGL